MILPIIQAPDGRLLQPSLPVGMLSTVLGDLFGALIDTRINHDGVGLWAIPGRRPPAGVRG